MGLKSMLSRYNMSAEGDDEEKPMAETEKKDQTEKPDDDKAESEKDDMEDGDDDENDDSMSAYAQGAADERQRMRAITEHQAAENNPALALSLACDEEFANLTADQAVGVLKKSSARASGAAGFREKMRSSKRSRVSSAPSGGGAKEGSKNRLLAARERRLESGKGRRPASS